VHILPDQCVLQMVWYIDGAAEEKNRLEELQRNARKDRKKSKDDFTPL
jgi:hypothetical protein